MKKSLILFSVAALALVSCAKVTDQYVGAPESHEIAFQAINQPATRSGAQTAASTFPYEMDVVAYSFVDASNKGDYFPSTVFAKNSSDVWAGKTTPRYWPLSPATLNFLAVSKPNVDGVSVTTTFGTADANWASKASVVLAGNYQTGSQIDLMYSAAQGAVTQGSGENANKLTYNGGAPVAMTFQHALAWVNFTVKAANVASEAITVNKITVRGGYYDGTFVINVNNYNNATAPTYGDYSWTVDAEDKADHDVPGVAAATGVSLDGTGDTGESAKSFGTEGLLLVPTTGITPATVSFTNFVINYTLNGNNYDFIYSVAPVLEKGKKYTYAITFTLTEITIEPSIADWTPVDATAVAVPTV